MPPKKMTANPLRPARHRPGKPAIAVASSSEDESEQESEQEAPKKKPMKRLPPAATTFPKSSLPIAHHTAAQSRAESDPRQQLEDEFETESEAASEQSETDNTSGQDTSEEETDSSEDEAPRKLLRPVFLRKDQRNQIAPKISQEEIHAQQERKRMQSANALVQEQIERDLAAQKAGKKAWDDEDNVGEIDLIDDTDNLDPEAEYAAWRLRELTRVKRDRIALEAAEAERVEIERRRNLSKEEKEAEDRDRLERQKEQREDRPKMEFMQKYFHKGAFFADKLAETGLDQRDLMGARFEDATNREVLPEYMRIRDMTKLGRKGRTKYKDMRSEDTGQWGDYGDKRPGAGGGHGLDARFRSDNHRSEGREGATGANARPLGGRKRVDEEDERSGKRMRVEDRYGP